MMNAEVSKYTLKKFLYKLKCFETDSNIKEANLFLKFDFY